MLAAIIAAPVAHEIVIQRSRFLTTLEPVLSVEAAEAVIARVRREHWGANHNCTAFVIGPGRDWQRSSDDGEPSGTAGVPMLEALRGRDVTDLVAVVTRYFGGVKLGAGGLVRAYSTAVTSALDVARLVRRRAVIPLTWHVPHSDAGRIDNWLRQWAISHDAAFEPPGYGALVEFTALVDPADVPAFTRDLASISAGALTPQAGTRRVIDQPA